ncbi:MAG: hypothetical protein D3M94_02865 [Rhodocyclales bacterium GT-UBC]|nr:MAG: hypothetical protein D3M94_02865 [Rhodocyclales bacterium GT-UBC]
MHLYAQASGDCFDTKNYSYPPDMSPFSDILDDWKTLDLTQVHDWVCRLADWHLEQVHVSEDLNEGFDIEQTMLFLYEILCWLRLREWAALESPAGFDHPLMQQSLAKLPEPVSLPIPDTPLLDQVTAKFKQEYPASFA